MISKLPLQQVVVFGASGDLAKRKIYPALYTLFAKKAIPENTKIIGYGRTQFEGTTFIDQVTSFIKPPLEPGFVSKCEYVNGPYSNFMNLQRWLDEDPHTECNRVFYLSLPPSSYKGVVELLPNLYSARGWNRVILEKPFGHDVESFKDLKQHVERYVPRCDTFLIDHYLGKAAVEHMRKSGPLKGKPKRIEVLFSEDLGVEGRQYFDESGIVRDIVQNHLLQLIAVLLNPQDKLGVLKSLTRFEKQTTRLGQYIEYPFKPSTTPTYMETHCMYKDIPIVIKAGKALNDKFVDIILEYEDVEKNQRINIQPFGAVTGWDESLLLDFVATEDAYEVMIRDVFVNDRCRFLEMDEIEESWNIVEGVLESDNLDFKYPKGELDIRYFK